MVLSTSLKSRDAHFKSDNGLLAEQDPAPSVKQVATPAGGNRPWDVLQMGPLESSGWTCNHGKLKNTVSVLDCGRYYLRRNQGVDVSAEGLWQNEGSLAHAS